MGLYRVLLAERELEGFQQRLAFGIVLGAGGDGDVHTAHGVDLFVLDFRKDDLLGDAEVVIALAIEALRQIGRASCRERVS
jgi:hypothetical protein